MKKQKNIKNIIEKFGRIFFFISFLSLIILASIYTRTLFLVIVIWTIWFFLDLILFEVRYL